MNFLKGLKALYQQCPVWIFFLFPLLLSGCSKAEITNRDSTGETIVCFGDSITRGTGVAKSKAYPAVLGEMIGDLKVINAGREGETSAQGLKRVNKILAHNPMMVIVEFGGNDFLKNIPEEETFSNIDEIVDRIQEEGAMVVLVSVRVGLMGDPYEKKLKKMAKEKGAVYIPNVMQGIMTKPDFKTDTVHPNAEGYRMIAEKIYKKIKPLLDE